MLVVWAVLFLGVLAGLVRGSEAIRNGWNPLTGAGEAHAQAEPLSVADDKVMHLCTDAKGQEIKQEAACPEIIKPVAGKAGKLR